jgi:hypothetical protein
MGSVFPSRNVAIHIVRGILGLGFLAIALQYSTVLGWWTLLPVAAALVCLGGCPMCWVVGLIETVLRRKSRTACAIKTDTSPASR